MMDTACGGGRFAVANTGGALWEQVGLDAFELVRAANFEYPRNSIPVPSPGVGGSCIPKDSRFLAYSSRSAGGRLPRETLPNGVVRIPSQQPGAGETLAQRLRSNTPPIVARIEDDAVLLDPRTDLPDDENDVRVALNNLTRKATAK